ncbi:hypothetical protein A8E25_31385 [Burkholderia cenocepacia]|nr:hypothetical protein A8E17_13040 [Burkholderia cenocepacia]ONR62005.1 hypothetical protein A8E23_29955 [Burkholderia cenocepacia]ONR72672.1 hypothetical protein A8E22_29780 [Burkholderia cenocepacia]ONR76671.1 hypothetical protein A8E18_07685 [Burkholderia cenocepacia]ONR83391.1 hypothetical protein A8E25_31385 [Burkholderia cenocepacia]
MPLREVLFGVSVATLVPSTLVGTTLATPFHIVETVLGTGLRLTACRGHSKYVKTTSAGCRRAKRSFFA